VERFNVQVANIRLAFDNVHHNWCITPFTPTNYSSFRDYLHTTCDGLVLIDANTFAYDDDTLSFPDEESFTTWALKWS
jgi:hypothetical protein